MGLGLLCALYVLLAAALRAAAGRIGPRVPAGWALALALLPLPFVGAGFLPGKTLAPTNALPGVAPWCAPELVAAARDGSTAPNSVLGDPLNQGEPWRRALRDDVALDRSAGSGAVLLAGAQAAPFFPPEYLGRFLPPARAATWIQAARLLIAAFGAFLFARVLGLRRRAALVAAATFVSAGFLQLWRAHALASVGALTPWLLAAAVAVARRATRRGVVHLAVTGAVAFLAGHPETLYQSAFLVRLAGVPVVAARLARRRRRGAAVRSAGALVAAGALGALLAAPAALPFLEALQVSTSWLVRASGHVPPAEEPLASVLGRLATAASLLWRGDPLDGSWTGSVSFADAGSGAVGAGALVLAAAGLAARRRRLALSWGVLGLAGLLVSVHAPLVAGAARLVPWLGRSLLDRLSLWWVVAAAVLAGLGVEALGRREARRAAAAAGAALLVLVAALAVLQPAARRPAALGIEVAGLAGACLLVVLRGRLQPPALAAFAALVVLLPRASYFATWVPVSSARTFFPETPAIRFVAERAAGFRVTGAGDAFPAGSGAFFGLEDPRSNDPMLFVDYARLAPWGGATLDEGWLRTEDPARPAFAYLGVKYVFDRPDATARPPLVEVYRGPDATVFENPAALPRLFVPRRLAHAADVVAAAEATRRIGEPSRTVVVTSPVVPSGVESENGWGDVTVLEARRDGLLARVDVRSSLLLASSQPAIPGWRVEVDGREVEPVRVNTAFLGVRLAPGGHEVRFRYAPRSLAAGIALFLVGSLVALAVAVPRLLPRLAAPQARWILAGVALVLGAAWVRSVLPLSAIGDASHDDALYVRLAEHVARGDWLGPYDESTLAKGPFYPFFIAFAHRAGVPLFAAQEALYAAACALFVLAVAPVVRAKAVRLLLFVLLVLNPVVVTRAAREGIYPALSLLALAGGIGVLARFPSSPRAATGWSVLCGLSLGALWLAREEGIWILPAVALLLAGAVARAAGDLPSAVRASGLALLPFALLGASLLGVALRNRQVYGVFTARESTDRPFTAAYGALSRIRHARPRPMIPVPSDVRRKAYARSATFRALEPYLEGEVGSRWTAVGAGYVPATSGDLAGGWLQFALREAAARAGAYRDAPAAAAFWRNVADELNGACSRGELDCLPERSTLTPPGALALLPSSLGALRGNLALLTASIAANATHNLGSSRGSAAARLRFERLARADIAPSEVDSRWVSVSGWAYRTGGGTVRWSARSPGGVPLPVAQSWSPSGDLAAWFSDPSAREARFRLEASCPGPCLLELSDAGSVLLSVEPSRPSEPIGTTSGEVRSWFDSVRVGRQVRDAGELERTRLRRAALESLAKTYGAAFARTLPAAAALFALAATVAALRRRARVVSLVAGALLGALVSRLVLLDLVERTSFPALHPLYLAPAYPLLYAFVVLAAVSAAGALASVPAVARAASYLWAKAATFGFTRRSKSS
jgi:hypothetical protein